MGSSPAAGCAVRCGAFSACAVVEGEKVPHWLPSRRQRIKSQLRPPSLIIEHGEQRLLGEIKARKRKSARGRAALERGTSAREHHKNFNSIFFLFYFF